MKPLAKQKPHKHFLKRRRANYSIGGDLFNLIVLLAFAAFMVLPLIYAICQSLKPNEEIFVFPPTFFVRNPTFDNFVDVVILMGQSWVPFSRYILNSVFVTVVGTLGHIIFASMAAYVLEKHKFPGRNAIFAMIVTSLMFSAHVTGIPNYIIMSKLGWIDTYLALIVPAFAYSFGLYLMKQFMSQVPDVMIEAARIDGASEFRIFRQIVMPSVKPAWLTLMIFQVQSLWGSPAGNYIYSEEMKMLPNALREIISAGISRAGAGAAVTVIIMLVPITVFVINQSNVMQTMATSGMKE